jgi:hypothetical protein
VVCTVDELATPRRSPAISAKYHDFIEFPFIVKGNIFAETKPLYTKGFSLREIELRTGIPKTVVRRELIRGGVSLRPTRMELKAEGWRKAGKSNVKPPFGFCYLEGRIVRNPKEYPVLHMIHQRWKAGLPANSIATWLNGKKVPSPMGKKWSWNSVVNVINRFKNGTIILNRGKYELR